MRSASGRARVRIWIDVFAIISALVLVPTLVRAQQHVDRRREPIRASVRLNWNGVTPPVKAGIVAQAATVIHDTVADTIEPPRVVQQFVTVDDLLPSSPPLTAPDALRGPPAFTLIVL